MSYIIGHVHVCQKMEIAVRYPYRLAGHLTLIIEDGKQIWWNTSKHEEIYPVENVIRHWAGSPVANLAQSPYFTKINKDWVHSTGRWRKWGSMSNLYRNCQNNELTCVTMRQIGELNPQLLVWVKWGEAVWNSLLQDLSVISGYAEHDS